MATVVIMSAFQNNGAPATGLTPVITIYDLSDNSVVVNAQNMTEVANGIYKYSFASYDYTKDYAIYVDGTATLNDVDRYQYGSNANEVWDAGDRVLTSAGSGDIALWEGTDEAGVSYVHSTRSGG